MSTISRRILGTDRHQAIYSAVALYEEALRKYLHEEEARPQLWLAVVSDEIYKYVRPKSSVPMKLCTPGARKLGMKTARSILKSGSMFAEEMQAAAVYEYELNFQDQLKVRLIDTGQLIQVAKEATLDPTNADKARMQDTATVAWNLSTTSFYKIGGRPWRFADLRDGVCYVGLVFKRIDRLHDEIEDKLSPAEIEARIAMTLKKPPPRKDHASLLEEMLAGFRQDDGLYEVDAVPPVGEDLEGPDPDEAGEEDPED